MLRLNCLVIGVALLAIATLSARLDKLADLEDGADETQDSLQRVEHEVMQVEDGAINSQETKKSTYEAHEETHDEVVAVAALPAPEGFSGPMKGYCKLALGAGPGNSPYGLGVVERDSVESCAAFCKEIQAPRTCRGFNYAPGVHNQCHLFGEHPEFGNSAWGWQCYSRDLVDEQSVPPVEEGVTCTDSEGDAKDNEFHRCEYYSLYPGMCGQYDDDDFTASSMCCACKDSAAKDDDEQGPKACKSWCYSKKHAHKKWSGDPDLIYNKCDWVNCAMCPECVGHVESEKTRLHRLSKKAKEAEA